MDPLTAIGLAGNIVQFLDLGGKVVSGAVELYNASDGATATNRVLEKTTTDLHRLCKELNQRAERFYGHLRTESEAALLPLVQSCLELGEEFSRLLENLRVEGRHKILRSAFKAVKSTWKMKDIQQYERRLNLYRSQISTCLLSILTDQQDFNFALHLKTHEQQAGLRETLSQLNESHKALGIQAKNRAAQLEETVVTHLRETANPCSNLAPLLTHLESESFNLRKQIQIIKSLQFPQIFERADNIKEAHPTTFEWLFEGKGKTVTHRQQSNIFDWLRTGNGTFWVSGKAGSGKSTLMKFFCNHHKTTAALKFWAKHNKIIVASFFFWNAGTRLQKSQQGLLRTLLLHIFRQDPALIAALCPQRWQSSALGEEQWNWTDLVDALANLKAHRTDTLKFCFFIDGLDEYDGEHMAVIKIIETLVSSPDIKICFSSRPWNVFETFYGDNLSQRLYLHELTHDDITRFTRDELAIGTKFSSQRSMRTAYTTLVQDIVDRAHGVFLWVFLVVRSLRRGMNNLDSPLELQVRLLELPTELEAFF